MRKKQLKEGPQLFGLNDPASTYVHRPTSNVQRPSFIVRAEVCVAVAVDVACEFNQVMQ